MPHTAISECLDSITSVHEVAQLRLLEDCLKLIDPGELTGRDRRAIFELFERFPEDDAYGGFSAFLHKLEASCDYEAELIASVQRMPTEFGLQMVARMIRGNIHSYRGQDLLSLIEQATSHPTSPESSRKFAKDCLVSLRARRSDA